MKKLLCVLLGTVLILSWFGGCGSNEQEINSSTKTTAVASESVNSKTANEKNTSIAATSSVNDKAANITNNTSGDTNSNSHETAQETVDNANESFDENQNGNKNENSAADEKISSSSKPVIKSNNSSKITSSSSKNNLASSSKSNSKPQSSNNESKVQTTQPQKNPNIITVYLVVDCITAVNAGYDIANSVSDNGIIFAQKSFEVKKGSSVYSLLEESGLVVVSSSSPMGVYVSSIQSLAEKACSNKSGWQYRVNGEFVNASCDKYTLNDGDVVAWRYTCNNGKDL